MGPRPRDFDEELVRRSPTFRKWEALSPGAKLRYACREFVKGHGEDEERLMRRIMIARRNNVRDHQALKWARRMQSSDVAKASVSVSKAAQNSEEQSSLPQRQRDAESPAAGKLEPMDNENAAKGKEAVIVHDRDNHAGASRRETAAIVSRTSHLMQQELEPPPGRRARRQTTLISDETIKEEMDVTAVEATRSYRTWLALPNGAEFLYNQKYIKGHEAHDWLLKKNIWRRMRYRRENKKMVEEMLSRERGDRPLSMIQLQQQSSRKRKLGTSETATSGSLTAHLNTTGGDADGVTIPQSGTDDIVASETNRQEVVASTASEIVDHALLSTNTGAVVAGAAASSMVSDANAAASDTITISIGNHHQHQHHQHQHHPNHALHHHHNDPTESAAAFAASIALAGSVVDVNGIGIGTHGDLSSHQVADSAAVEAAVAAALAATDAKSNAYHQHHEHHHHHHHHHAGDLMDVNDVIDDTNNPLQPGAATGGMSVAVGPGLPPSVVSSATPPSVAAAAAAVVSSASPASGDVGLGLALDAAAKLAAAAAATTNGAEDVVLAATTAIANGGSVGVEKGGN